MKAGEKKISENLMKERLEFLKRCNHTFLKAAERFGLSVIKQAVLFDTHVQIERKSLR